MKQIIVALVVAASVCLPSRAGTWRDDFDIDNLSHWNIHNVCIGFNFGGERSVKVENGVAKIKDNSKCSIQSSVGLFRLEPWIDYELTTRIKVISFRHNFAGVEILVRVQHCRGDILPVSCRGGPPNVGFKSSPLLLIRPANIQFNMQPANIILDHWYEVKIIAKGLEVTYFFDGQKIKEERTESVTGGIALIGSEAEFWLDYVEVSGADILAVSPKSKLTRIWGKIKAGR